MLVLVQTAIFGLRTAAQTNVILEFKQEIQTEAEASSRLRAAQE